MTLKIQLDVKSGVPFYRQIIDQIKYQIATGVLQSGDRLPSVRELAIKLAVNQNTVLKVYNELCREQVLKVERGDGTYVSGWIRLNPAFWSSVRSSTLFRARVCALA